MENFILKGDILDQVLKNLALSGSLINPDPTTTETILRYMEYGVLELEANGIRIGWMASEDPTNPSTGDDSGIPAGLLAPLARWIALNACPSIGIQPSPQLQMMARSAPQVMMKFDWRGNTPVTRIRGGSPIGSGNTKYRYIPDFAPYVQDIEVENNTTLGGLIE